MREIERSDAPKGDTERLTKKLRSIIIGVCSGLTAFFAAVGVVGAFVFIVKKAGVLLNIIK